MFTRSRASASRSRRGHNEGERDQRQHQARAYKVARLECLGPVSDHVLRRVDHENETEADDELQQHGHADYVDAGRAHTLQYRDDDRNHRRGKRRGAGKAEVDHDQEQRHDAENEHRGRVLEAKFGDDNVGEPGAPLVWSKAVPRLIPTPNSTTVPHGILG